MTQQKLGFFTADLSDPDFIEVAPDGNIRVNVPVLFRITMGREFCPVADRLRIILWANAIRDVLVVLARRKSTLTPAKVRDAAKRIAERLKAMDV